MASQLELRQESGLRAAAGLAKPGSRAQAGAVSASAPAAAAPGSASTPSRQRAKRADSSGLARGRQRKKL